MFKKILSIISLVLSGFFLHSFIFFAFTQVPSPSIKLILMGIFLIPVLLTLLIGLALRSFSRWQRVCGIVFLGTSAFFAFTSIVAVCMFYTPEYQAIIDPETLTLFSDLVFGIAFFLLVLLLGTILFYQDRSI